MLTLVVLLPPSQIVSSISQHPTTVYKSTASRRQPFQLHPRPSISITSFHSHIAMGVFCYLVIGALAFHGVSASPTRLFARDTDHPFANDTNILNFALTLEHLENVFYTTGLQNFSQQDFDKAGLPSGTRGFYEQISAHEQTHVDTLTATLASLGAPAVQACTYNYGVNGNVSTFVELSDLFETVGASAYSGAAHYLNKSDLLTVAASILATEARQSTWINNAIRGANPWSTAFETPLDLNQVFTLGIRPNPPLTATPPTALPGQNVSLTFNASKAGNTTLFAAFLNGLNATYVQLNGSQPFNVSIPQNLTGTTFLAITNSSSEHADNVTVAGPAFFNFAFGADNQTVPLKFIKLIES
ncbi:hypothetical protein EVG20_g7682 [Dentipellis fragilis]|uniref:Uncharacterized protein n=1 Tax=Dentipellis fragilis TaxID=205917 RepID=A0A4Y9YAY6_9AGAM|nr:hypothetical protein EVG20_g7682 [Dentipellis fragilis]